MARTIFLILLLLNLAGLAWMITMGAAKDKAGREPQRNATQMLPDKIRIVPVPDETALSATSAAVPVAPPSEICLAYTGAAVSDAQLIVKMLSEKLPAVHAIATAMVPASRFDMVIPGLASRQAAEVKLAELKKLGVDQGVGISTDDPKGYALLIASFAERALADDALKVMAKKGVRSAAIVERKPVPEKSTIEIRGSESAMKSLPQQLAAYKSLVSTACAAP